MATARLFTKQLPDGRWALQCEAQVEPGDDYPEGEDRPWRDLLHDWYRNCWTFEFRSRAEALIQVSTQLDQGDIDLREAEDACPGFTRYLDAQRYLVAKSHGFAPWDYIHDIRLQVASAIAHGNVNPCDAGSACGVYAHGGVPEDAIAALGPLPKWVHAGALPGGGYGLVLDENRKIGQLVKLLSKRDATEPDTDAFLSAGANAPAAEG